MRLIHTADWHLGRRLKGVDRTPEIAAALDALLNRAVSLQADALLIAGDLFDQPNPTAEAERVAWKFFRQLGEAGIPAVAIAGNHDSATRLDGVTGLLLLAGVTVVGPVRERRLVEVPTRHGLLRVAALPFASERRLFQADELVEKDDAQLRQGYADVLGRFMNQLARGFTPDAVNVLMAHVALSGATLSRSEVAFVSTGGYSFDERALPGSPQYIALGHIHKRQHIQASAPAYYAGSLIQVDFGEAEEQKGVNVIDVEPGRPAQVRFAPIAVTKPLLVVKASGSNLDAILQDHKDHPGYLKVIVDLDAPELGLADRVRKTCPQALVVEPRYPTERATDGSQGALHEQVSPAEAFTRYFADRYAGFPDPAVLQAFQDLHDELTHAPA